MTALAPVLTFVSWATKSPTPVASTVQQPNWVQIGTLVATIGIAAITAWITIYFGRLNRARVLRDDRQELRGYLRDWFQGLSSSATPEVKRQTNVLRSLIDETTDASGYTEIVDLMAWARSMVEESRARVFAPQDYEGEALTEDEAHLRRIIVKRRFRQMAARWANNRAAGTKLITAYCPRGWAAIAAEPLDAAKSSTFLHLSAE
jgi:hypothetical protein